LLRRWNFFRIHFFATVFCGILQKSAGSWLSLHCSQSAAYQQSLPISTRTFTALRLIVASLEFFSNSFLCNGVLWDLTKKRWKLVVVALQSVGCLSAISAHFYKNFHGAAIDCCVAGIFSNHRFSFSLESLIFISLQRSFVGSYKKA
jgi:hypothetical protein